MSSGVTYKKKKLKLNNQTYVRHNIVTEVFLIRFTGKPSKTVNLMNKKNTHESGLNNLSYTNVFIFLNVYFTTHF